MKRAGTGTCPYKRRKSSACEHVLSMSEHEKLDGCLMQRKKSPVLQWNDKCKQKNIP